MKKILIPMSDSKTQHFINQAYVSYIQEAGFIPVLLPQSAYNLDDFVAMADGLLLPGGVDIDPIHYEECNYNCRSTEVEKDIFERSILHKVMLAQKPVFGICRGFQLLVRELKNEFGLQQLQYKQHIGSMHNTPEALNVSRKSKHHDIIADGFALWGIEEKGNFSRFFVNSMHHQGVVIKKKILFEEVDGISYIKASIGPVAITAYSDYGTDAKEESVIVEAIEADWNGCRIKAVQWHPEELNDVALIKTHFLKEEQHEMP